MKIQHREELLLSLRQKRKRGDKKLQQLGENQACEKPCFKGARVVNSLDIQHEPALLVCHMGFRVFSASLFALPSPLPFFPEVCSSDRGIVRAPLYRKLISSVCLLGVIGQ